MMRSARFLKHITAALLSAALCMQTALAAVSASAASQSDLDAFCSQVRQAWKNRTTRAFYIDQYKLTLDEVSNIYCEMLYSEGEWFYVSSGFRYSLNDNGYVSTFLVNYNYDVSTISSRKTEFNEKVSEIISMIRPSWSDAEKILFLHDYLAEHCHYDTTFDAASYNAYSAIVTGSSVCQGYALAMCVLCKELGIPCYTVTYDATIIDNGEEKNDRHMWNLVQADGEWYHVDVTFDDYAPDMIGHVSHDYLLQSDAEMLNDPNQVHHTEAEWGYYTNGQTITCDSDTYVNAFFRSCTDSVQPLDDGSWVYANHNQDAYYAGTARVLKATICQADFNGNLKQLAEVPASWRYQNYYAGCFVSTLVYGDDVYYHTTDSIYRMPLDGSKAAEKIYTLNSEQRAIGSIYGMTVDADGLLTYQVMESYVEYLPPQQNYTLQLEKSNPAETTAAPAVTAAQTTETTVTTANIVTAAPAVTTEKPEVTSVPAATTAPKITEAPAKTTVPAATTASAAVTKAPETTEPVGTSATTAPKTTEPAATAAAKTTEPAATAAATTVSSVQATTAPAAVTAAATTVPAVTETMPVRTDIIVTTNAVIVTAAPQTTAAAAVSETKPVVTTQTTADVKPVMKKRGDVNEDQVVDVSDAVLLARFSVGADDIIISEQGLANGDCNGDGRQDTGDVLWIIQYIIGLITDTK